MPNFEPGHFALPLVINIGDLPPVEVKYKQSILEQYLKLKTNDPQNPGRVERPERHAIRHLLGLLAARLDNFDEATKYFKQVLSEDPSNLNAIANCKSLCETLNKVKESSKYADNLHELMHELNREAIPKGKNGSDQQEQIQDIDWQKRKARCLAEQAYAFAFDILDDIEGYKQYMEAHELYTQAIELAGEYVDDTEIQDWEFGNAIACRKVCIGLMKASKPHSKYYEISLKYFHRITATGNDDMKSESWRHMAELFSWFNTVERPRCVIDNPELEPYFKCPVQCIKKALEITPDHPQHLARLAKMISDKRTPEANWDALQLLKRSTELDESRCNRYAFAIRAEIYAFAIRAEIYLEIYRKQRYANEDPDQDLLTSAEKNLEKALELDVSPFEYSYLASVWHERARDPDGSFSMDSNCLACFEKALEYHEEAIKCKKGNMRESTHKYRGICLLDFKKYDEAIESFKKALELGSQRKSSSSFYHLLIAYFTKFSYLGSDASSAIPPWSEIADCALKAIKTYRESIQKPIQDLWNRFPEKMEMFLSHCKNMDDSDEKQRLITVFSPERSQYGPGHVTYRSGYQQIDNTPDDWRR